MTANDLTRDLRDYLDHHQGPTPLPARVRLAVRSDVSQTRQARRWPARIPIPAAPSMRASATFATATALAALAVVAIASLSLGPATGGPKPSGSGAAGDATWLTTGPMVTPRGGLHTATLLRDGRVLVTGGGTAAAELLDPTTLTWSATGAMTEPRSDHTATLLPDGRVLVAGGTATLYGSGAQRTAEIFDPETGTWTATGDMTYPRALHSATLLPDGRVLVAGATTLQSAQASAEIYDPVAGSWTTTGSMPVGRWRQTATLLPSGIVLVTGGEIGDVGPGPCCQPVSSALLFDPSAETWAVTGSMVGLTGGSSAALLPDGTVLVVGPFLVGRGNSAELYDPVAGSWAAAPGMLVPRFGVTATVLPDGRVLAAGGTLSSWGNEGARLDGVDVAELYDPMAGTWTLANDLLAPRFGQVAVRLLDGRVLLVGGASTYFHDGRTVPSDPGAEVHGPVPGS